MANNSHIYIIGGPASGKSTLINAMIGKRLMPYSLEKPMFIEFVDIDNFKGFAYGHDAEEIMRNDNSTQQALSEWNHDYRVSSIAVMGRIPFVRSLNMNVGIVRVPCVSKSLWHLISTIGELDIVVFVLSSFYYDKQLLDKIILCIGRYNHGFERLFFVANKMDFLNPEEEDANQILSYFKSDISNNGILDPTIFPLSAWAALEARTRPVTKYSLSVFRQYIKHFPSTHFDSYYNFSKLPDYIRMEIEYELIMSRNNMNKKEGEYSLIEIHSGIVSLEKAIMLRLNKMYN